jgi:hypothetical protein
MRVHGLRSGRMLREFRGHKSYVNSALYSVDGAQVCLLLANGFSSGCSLFASDVSMLIISAGFT